MPEITERRRMRPLLGCFVEAGAHALNESRADAALAAAFSAMEDMQRRLSFHDPDSELSRLNGAQGRAVSMHVVSLRLLRLARALMRVSGGLFDVTVGGTLVRQGSLPDHHPYGPLLERGSADDIELGAGWARLARPVRLTLDGIAKGYAVDAGVSALRAAGASAGWVNAGGDLRVFGDVALAVQRREADGLIVPLGSLRNAALASSHIGPPSRDFPALIVSRDREMPRKGAVFSVLARRAWRADALTKVACLAAPTVRDALLARLGGCLVSPEELQRV